MGELADLVVVPSQPPLAGGRRDRLAALLELAAADDVDGLRGALAEGGEEAAELADGVGLWYGRSKAYEARTPLMVAATYGSAGWSRCWWASAVASTSTVALEPTAPPRSTAPPPVARATPSLLSSCFWPLAPIRPPPIPPAASPPTSS